MKIRSLLIINGTLLALLLVAGMVYLISSRPPSPGNRRDEGMPSPLKRDQARVAIVSESAVMEPSERFLSDAQWRQQKESDSAENSQRQGSQGEELVVVSPPVAFLEPAPSVVLNENDARAIQAVRESFSDAMRRAGDPSSPEYLKRWLTEKERADDLLSAYLGPVEFSKLHSPGR